MLRRTLVTGLCIAGWLALGVAGCSNDEPANQSHAGQAPQGTQTGTPAVVAGEYEAFGAGAMELQPAVGWLRTAGEGLAIFGSPDGKARLLVATVDAADDMNPALDRAAKMLGVMDHKWATARKAQVGADQMPATIDDGYAKYASGLGGISYALLDEGPGKKTLIMYAMEKDLAEEVKTAGMKTITTVRRKR